MPEILACFTNAGDGGNTRVSLKTDSMFADMPFPPPEREYNHQNSHL
jgi:hypothetical protein